MPQTGLDLIGDLFEAAPSLVVEGVRLSDSPSLFRQGGSHRFGVPVRPDEWVRQHLGEVSIVLIIRHSASVASHVGHHKRHQAAATVMGPCGAPNTTSPIPEARHERATDRQIVSYSAPIAGTFGGVRVPTEPELWGRLPRPRRSGSAF